eukprot:scaffold21169_cov125-Isochrysis_galbana.AAC.4
MAATRPLRPVTAPLSMVGHGLGSTQGRMKRWVVHLVPGCACPRRDSDSRVSGVRWGTLGKSGENYSAITQQSTRNPARVPRAQRGPRRPSVSGSAVGNGGIGGVGREGIDDQRDEAGDRDAEHVDQHLNHRRRADRRVPIPVQR